MRPTFSVTDQAFTWIDSAFSRERQLPLAHLAAFCRLISASQDDRNLAVDETNEMWIILELCLNIQTTNPVIDVRQFVRILAAPAGGHVWVEIYLANAERR